MRRVRGHRSHRVLQEEVQRPSLSLLEEPFWLGCPQEGEQYRRGIAAENFPDTYGGGWWVAKETSVVIHECPPEYANVAVDANSATYKPPHCFAEEQVGDG